MTPRRAGPASIRRQGGRKPGSGQVGARAPRAPEGAAIGTPSARLVTPVRGQRAVRRSGRAWAEGPHLDGRRTVDRLRLALLAERMLNLGQPVEAPAKTRKGVA